MIVRGIHRSREVAVGREQVGYGDFVTSLEVVLVMAGGPLAIMVVLALLTLGPQLSNAGQPRAVVRSVRPCRWPSRSIDLVVPMFIGIGRAPMPDARPYRVPLQTFVQMES